MHREVDSSFEAAGASREYIVAGSRSGPMSPVVPVTRISTKKPASDPVSCPCVMLFSCPDEPSEVRLLQRFP